jgi:DNA end-binding protein Ku
MRAIWKGSISFGLVNIPVGLYAATRSSSAVKFKLLRQQDHSPVRYKRVAEADGAEVPWDQIVKGYEYQKEQFIVLDENDFERVDLPTKQTVDIKEFVQLSEIDPMFFDQPYFLAPERGGDKAYALLRESLRRTGKAAIAKVVIKTREHLAAVKPHGDALVLELMHFADELADPAELKLPQEVALSKKELGMAESLIESMTGPWEPARYQDEYKNALLEVIQEKIEAGGRELPAEKRRRAKAPSMIDLVSVLQESLEITRKGNKPAQKKQRKAA